MSLNTTGIGNSVFDEGEDVFNQGAKSIQRIGSGLQHSGNALARGFLGGINGAHREAMNTFQDAFLSECFKSSNICLQIL